MRYETLGRESHNLAMAFDTALKMFFFLLLKIQSKLIFGAFSVQKNVYNNPLHRTGRGMGLLRCIEIHTVATKTTDS